MGAYCYCQRQDGAKAKVKPFPDRAACKYILFYAAAGGAIHLAAGTKRKKECTHIHTLFFYY